MFVIKSYSEEDVHRSIKYGVWSSTENGNLRLDAGFRELNGLNQLNGSESQKQRERRGGTSAVVESPLASLGHGSSVLTSNNASSSASSSAPGSVPGSALDSAPGSTLNDASGDVSDVVLDCVSDGDSIGAGSAVAAATAAATAAAGPVYLFFSVNGSGHFCGMAEMVTAVDHDTGLNCWAQSKWKGQFQVLIRKRRDGGRERDERVERGRDER
jgi:hypothetical protein